MCSCFSFLDSLTAALTNLSSPTVSTTQQHYPRGRLSCLTSGTLSRCSSSKRPTRPPSSSSRPTYCTLARSTRPSSFIDLRFWRASRRPIQPRSRGRAFCLPFRDPGQSSLYLPQIRQVLTLPLWLYSSGSCVKAAVELLTHVSGTWSTTCHGNWWSSVGYEYSACLVVLACESCSSGFRLLFLWFESDPQVLLFPDQISQRIRGKDAAAFLDPPVLDHQASAAVTAGLNTLHGLSHVNQGLSSEDLRASPDMIQAAGRSYSIISRLRDVLLNSYNAPPMSDLPLFGSSWDLAAAAYPSIPDDPFRSTWEGDDTFVNDILQSKWWGTYFSVRYRRRLSDSTSSLLAQCSDLSSSSSTPLQPSSARSHVVLALVSSSNRPRRLILGARDAVGEVGGGRGHSLVARN